MVHPGFVVAGVLGVVVTGVVIYSILKEEIDDFLQSLEHQKVPVGSGGHGNDDQQKQRSDHNDPTSSSSSGIYHGDYELRQRRLHHDMDVDDNEKELERTPLTERLQKIREAEANMAASQARLDEMERQMNQREAALLQSIREREERMERELEQSRERQRLLDQEMASYRQEPLARSMVGSSTPLANDPLIPSFGDDHDASSEVDSRANAILRHNLSSSHQENYNPFENPNLLLGAESSNFAIYGDEERSVTVGDEGSEVDWTEAEIGSVGSHDSYESWASPGSP
ncbi:hypothetical protein BG005_010767 [Podila minutissima]|nr:hypothetical protein BG005_010767 [Podila minutissima]